ncbi:MAG: hypothetical protein AAF827_23225, partial [Cyanobacteria bacterium P01_D01_bin.6]
VPQQYIVHNRYVVGKDLPTGAFPQQTVVRLPDLPDSIHPQVQVEGANHSLLRESPVRQVFAHHITIVHNVLLLH